MNRRHRIGPRLSATLVAGALCLAMAQAQTLLPEEPPEPQLQLQLDTGLSGLSQQRLADGTAVGQPQPEPQPEPEPVITIPSAGEPAFPRFFSTLPALLLAAVVLALIAFAAGVVSARRRPVIQREDDAPAQLWGGTESLEREVDTLRDQLAEQQVLNESLQADRDAREDELVVLRRQRDEANSESQILRMRGGDDEIAEAHETIDELRAEIERLRGADTDLEHDPHRFEGGDEPEALRAELEARDTHVRELEEVMQAVRAERDAFEQSVAGRDAQVQALEETLDHRDEELGLLRAELAIARDQSGAAVDDQVRELSEQLETARKDAAREIEALQDRLNERHEGEERADELHRRNQQLENDLAERREELIQLAGQNDTLKSRMTELEFALKRDEDLTARLELGSLEEGKAGTDVANLERQNVKLSAMILQRDNMVAELEAKIAELGGSDDEQPEEWTSTVSSLENELRRKTSVIDDQADHLREGEQRVEDLQAQIASLGEQLDASRDESESLQALLAEAQAQAKTLGGELDRERQAGKSQQADAQGEPLSPSVEVETLESTVHSNRELVKALQSILDQENAALSEARKLASEREDLLVSLENEIASNRITIAALQNRVANAREHGSSPPSGETQRLERELQRGVRMIEKLRTDLHLWRRRVKPLHEAVVARDTRIQNLDAQLNALREGRAKAVVVPAQTLTADDSGVFEKNQYFQNIAELQSEAKRLENELADTGLALSRTLAADETQIQEIENLEAARAAQAMRIDELHHELVNLGVTAEVIDVDDDNVVELQVQRPAT